MENNKLFKAVERSTQDIPTTLNWDSSKRWTIQSQKTKYVNGKMSGAIEVGYTASINNSDYLLEEDKSNNAIQITALAYGTSGTCVLTQNESGNIINLKITTPDYWEIHFKPLAINGVNTDDFFIVTTNISGEMGSMAYLGGLYKNLIVNHNRHTINVYISPIYMTDMYQGSLDILSWSCLDKDGNPFSPNYNIPDNQYFTTRTTGLGSYTLKKISMPSVGNGDLLLSSRFNPTKKYPLALDFYFGDPR